jgi:Raf kinase inhibitor-like YbhB/YbcL family protein
MKVQMAIELESEVLRPGERIPLRYTGEGEDLSPPLRWGNLPDSTKELALVVDDPDAPTSDPFVHWVLYKIPANARGLPEGVGNLRQKRIEDPILAFQGKNSFGKIGYNGPLPPPGHGVHHYHFKLYALDRELEVEEGLEKDDLCEAMSGHVLDDGELIGTYSR